MLRRLVLRLFVLRPFVLRLFVLLGVLLVAPLGALANAPAVHAEEDVTGGVFVCDDATYTITSGIIRIVMHEGASASGNVNFTLTVTPQHVTATDGTDTYSIGGAFWVGGTFNAQQGRFETTVTDHFQIVKPGAGTVGRVQTTFHLSISPGDVKVVDHTFGNCVSPA